MEVEYWHPTKNNGPLGPEHNTTSGLHWFQCPTCHHEWQTTIAKLHGRRKKPCVVCQWPANRKRVKKILEKMLKAGHIQGFEYLVRIPAGRLKMDFRVQVTPDKFFYCWPQLPIYSRHYSLNRGQYIINWERRKEWCLQENIPFLELPHKGPYAELLAEFRYTML
jgi:Zn-finger protein